MKAYIGKTPIKLGSIIYYNGTMYKIMKIEKCQNDTSFVFKAKIVKEV